MLIETVARWRTTALLSTFGFGHVREYAPVSLSLSALYFTTVQRLSRFAYKSARMALRATFSYSEQLSWLARAPKFIPRNIFIFLYK
ncbi:hypothetical protein IX332_001112 [Porphyromonas levii]|nr:hypothetical protein [Porphyromonas levii]MBR8713383.1 hypothetical protein [Porphyromonas levii]MBR8715418.1 hypothetical protein [Porphyromonas levii]MBR8727931.1 hypothetical protein [Porphyromonas levii]MBR8729788.1 hypothetical protein [Porphyromonas levii]